jgi:hypothetical protein
MRTYTRNQNNYQTNQLQIEQMKIAAEAEARAREAAANAAWITQNQGMSITNPQGIPGSRVEIENTAYEYNKAGVMALDAIKEQRRLLLTPGLSENEKQNINNKIQSLTMTAQYYYNQSQNLEKHIGENYWNYLTNPTDTEGKPDSDIVPINDLQKEMLRVGDLTNAFLEIPELAKFRNDVWGDIEFNKVLAQELNAVKEPSFADKYIPFYAGTKLDEYTASMSERSKDMSKETATQKEYRTKIRNYIEQFTKAKETEEKYLDRYLEKVSNQEYSPAYFDFSKDGKGQISPLTKTLSSIVNNQKSAFTAIIDGQPVNDLESLDDIAIYGVTDKIPGQGGDRMLVGYESLKDTKTGRVIGQGKQVYIQAKASNGNIGARINNLISSHLLTDYTPNGKVAGSGNAVELSKVISQDYVGGKLDNLRTMKGQMTNGDRYDENIYLTPDFPVRVSVVKDNNIISYEIDAGTNERFVYDNINALESALNELLSKQY